MKMQKGMGAEQVGARKRERGEELPYAAEGGEEIQGQGNPMRPGLGKERIAQSKVQLGIGAETAREDTPTAEEAAPTTEEAAPASVAERRRGMSGIIGRAEVAKAEETLKKYKDGKSSLEKRIVDNEQWYKMRHWEQLGHSENRNDPEPTSAWLLNSIANKHADAMDNYPAPNVLPREEGDEGDAKLLSSVLPAVLEQTGFEQTYSDMWWYKLKMGTGVMGVFWDASKENGLGDIDVRALDLLNLFWEPGVKDIQKSRNLFHVDLYDREALEDTYPEMRGKLGGTTVETAKYIYDDTIDTTQKVAVVDWYYKRRMESGKTVLHYCKFCGGQVLYASENDTAYAERGYYDHGRYPVVFDTLFPEEGTPAGFGYLDVCKSPQMYIDKLDQAIIKNAVIGARPRFWARADGAVNEKEYADLSKDFVHYAGNGNPNECISQIPTTQLNDIYVTVRQLKVDELKETSGNRDFNQGGTGSGITAASAIAALQEAGSKLSRDMIKASYRAFSAVSTLCIELMRQFYQEERSFRIAGEQGKIAYEKFNGQRIAEKNQRGDFGMEESARVPVFDIKVSAQKSSPFSTVAQNERAKELYSMGFFRPDMCDQASAALDMMQFDAIDKVKARIGENGSLLQKLEQLGQISMAMAQQIDAATGSGFTAQIAQLTGMMAQGATSTPPNSAGASGDVGVNALGDAFDKSRAQTASAARNDTAGKATPR